MRKPEVSIVEKFQFDDIYETLGISDEEELESKKVFIGDEFVSYGNIR